MSSHSELQTEQIREAISHSNISKKWIEMLHEALLQKKYTLCNTPSLHFSLNSQFGLFKRWGKTSPNLKKIEMVACIDTARTLKTTKQIQTRPSRLSEKTWLPYKQEIVKKNTLFTPYPRKIPKPPGVPGPLPLSFFRWRLSSTFTDETRKGSNDFRISWMKPLTSIVLDTSPRDIMQANTFLDPQAVHNLSTAVTPGQRLWHAVCRFASDKFCLGSLVSVGFNCVVLPVHCDHVFCWLVNVTMDSRNDSEHKTGIDYTNAESPWPGYCH